MIRIAMLFLLAASLAVAGRTLEPVSTDTAGGCCCSEVCACADCQCDSTCTTSADCHCEGAEKVTAKLSCCGGACAAKPDVI